MRGSIRLALGTALAGGAFSGAMAQTGDFILLDTITLTASGEPVAVSRTGASVTVLDEEDIARAGTLSFGNLLAQQPGVSFSAAGGPGTTSSVRIRGLSSGYIGARLDGFDVSDTAGINFEFNFNTLGTGGLSRVEVLRGSQSARYGSEAIAGVIDVTTYRPTGDGFTGMARVETGTASTHTAELGVGYLSDRAELAFSASRTVSDGGFSAREGGTEDDGYDITTAAAYAAVQVNDNLRLGANFLWRDSYSEYDDFDLTQIPPLLESGTWSHSYQRGLRVFAEFETGTIHHELAYMRLENERIEMSGRWGPGDFDGTRSSLTYYGNSRPSDTLSLNWGYEDASESFSSYGDMGEVRTRAIHAEALYTPNSTLDLSLAVRHDEHGLFGGKSTGRLAAAWRPANGWTVRAAAGNGFRAPSLYELYSGWVGNPDLMPETSRSLEFGIERELASGAALQITAFDMRIKNRIEGDPITWEFIQTDNETASRGIEVSGRAEIAQGWAVFGNYTYTDARVDDGTSTERALRVPRHSLTLGVEGDLTDRLSMGATLHHSAGSIDLDTTASPAVRVPLPDYTLTSVNFRYALDAATEATFRVENLFDQDYQTAFGYNQPGRQVFVGVRTAF